MPQPYDFLYGTVRIVVVDDEEVTRNAISEYLSDMPIYSVGCCASAAEAERLLGKRGAHVCLLDLGISDVQDDQFYLLRKFAEKIPFIIVTGSGNIEDAFQAYKLNAVDAVAKPSGVFSGELLKKINEAFLGRFLFPPNFLQDEFVSTSYALLLAHMPEGIGAWAELLAKDESYLRRKWSSCCGIQPRMALCLVRMFSSALDFFGNQETICEEPEFAERFREFYYCNKSTILSILDRQIETDALVCQSVRTGSGKKTIQLPGKSSNTSSC